MQNRLTFTFHISFVFISLISTSLQDFHKLGEVFTTTEFATTTQFEVTTTDLQTTTSEDITTNQITTMDQITTNELITATEQITTTDSEDKSDVSATVTNSSGEISTTLDHISTASESITVSNEQSPTSSDNISTTSDQYPTAFTTTDNSMVEFANVTEDDEINQTMTAYNETDYNTDMVPDNTTSFEFPNATVIPDKNSTNRPTENSSSSTTNDIENTLTTDEIIAPRQPPQPPATPENVDSPDMYTDSHIMTSSNYEERLDQSTTKAFYDIDFSTSYSGNENMENSSTAKVPENSSEDTPKEGSKERERMFMEGPKGEAGLTALVVFGCLFTGTVIVLVSKRCYDGYQKRHYSRMDYLINGMYN